ncbi:hypothetical protein SANTM175S_05460 [Streptomyces antimycoticus]
MGRSEARLLATVAWWPSQVIPSALRAAISFWLWAGSVSSE